MTRWDLKWRRRSTCVLWRLKVGGHLEWGRKHSQESCCLPPWMFVQNLSWHTSKRLLKKKQHCQFRAGGHEAAPGLRRLFSGICIVMLSEHLHSQGADEISQVQGSSTGVRKEWWGESQMVEGHVREVKTVHQSLAERGNDMVSHQGHNWTPGRKPGGGRCISGKEELWSC